MNPFSMSSSLLCSNMLVRNLQNGSHHLRYFKWLCRSERLVASTLIKSNYFQRRHYDLQEYQSKQLLHENGIQVQRFKVVSRAEEARDLLFPEEKQELIDDLSDQKQTSETGLTPTEVTQPTRWLGFDTDISTADEFVIKAQVLAGGRGKGIFVKSGLVGGVQLTRDRHDALRFTQQMLNDRLITKQTNSDGVLVQKVMIAEAVRLSREFYFAIVLDRSYDSGPIFVSSPTGGMDIEEVAEKDPSAIRRFTIPIDTELDFDTARRISMAAFDLSMKDLDLIDQCGREIMRLHAMFLKLDVTQVEINPLGVTRSRKVVCVDAKVNFDENARFRHKWIDDLEEMNQSEMDSRDFEARKLDLNYIGLDGSIGCLVNGAGLAMATMDIIKLHGGSPANFLDVGGAATVKQVTEAFRIISSDPKVKAILVNIFGGIVRCDVIAEGIIQAVKTLKLKTPIICRLQGTRVDDAKTLMEASGITIYACDDLDEAANLAVKVAQA